MAACQGTGFYPETNQATPTQQEPDMKASDVTIVLPTRNEQNNIPSFLSSLPEECHLIVVDSSEDNTAELIREIRPERTRILRKVSNIPEARQAGVELATTQWLLFTDADILFPVGYFDLLDQYDGYDCVYGSKLSVTGYRKYYRYFAYAQQASHSIGIPAATGSNLLVKRKIIAAVGGFDPNLVCNEDSELVWRIKRSGFRTTYAPDLIVIATDHRRLEKGILRKTLHSLFRCTLLYFNLIPAKWRRYDWGYWSESTHRNRQG